MATEKIFPLAYELIPGLHQKIYYLAFPSKWKADLLEINRQFRDKNTKGHGLPTNSLKKILFSWMENIIDLSPLKEGSDDSHWLVSNEELDSQQIQLLCEYIKIWIRVSYYTRDTKEDGLLKVNSLVEDICTSIKKEDLQTAQSSEDVCLTYEDGTVSSCAYNLIPAMAVNRLTGKDIYLSGHTVHLCYVEKNNLVSAPLQGPGDNLYSIALYFSVQTTPSHRKALLLCHISTRRWIYTSPKEKKNESPFLKDAINAHIRIGDSKYCRIPIAFKKAKKNNNNSDKENNQSEKTNKKGKICWNEIDKACYEICGFKTLPDVINILKDPVSFYRMPNQILLPYKNGMPGYPLSWIGTGIPVPEKAAFHQEIFPYISDLAISCQSFAERCPNKRESISVYKSPEEYASREDFRKWVGTCAETNCISFELYGNYSDNLHKQALEMIEDQIRKDFGENVPDSCLEIKIKHKEIGFFTDEITADDDGNKYQVKVDYCNKVKNNIGPANEVTGCLILIPSPENYGDGDPKNLLRNAFAQSGRVVQFINPVEKVTKKKSKKEKEKTLVSDFPYRVRSAVYDLYRQLGIVTLLNQTKKASSLTDIPCIGMYLYTQIHGASNKGYMLPLTVICDIKKGITRVQCSAFSKHSVSYREACLEMAQLFWNNNLESLCKEISRSPVKKVLIEWRNNNKDALFFVQSNGNTRKIWNGISDKAISEQDSLYSPEKIDIGTASNPYLFTVKDTNIRIMRIRTNEEVPDYYTPMKEGYTKDNPKHLITQGIFNWDDTFWGIAPKPYNKSYNLSVYGSRLNHPEQQYAEKDLTEFYPLRLKPGDSPEKWVTYSNNLRSISIQYDKTTILPLPLHLAKCLEEYLLDI